MTERLNHGGWDYDDYDDNLDHEGDYQEDFEQEYTPPVYDDGGDADSEYDGDDTGAEGFQDQHDLVEHQVDFAMDDSGDTDFEEQFGWRSKARRRRQGRFVPPDMTWHRRPVFVRVKDLQGQDIG